MSKAKSGDKRIGNEFWKIRSKHGRDKIFSTPDIMFDAACEYFNWCEDNPITDPRSFGKAKVQRPFTKEGLCIFLGVNTDYFRTFKSQLPEGEKEFNTVLKLIDDILYKQKYENAVIGVYKENIISRDLGLKEQSDHNVNGLNIIVQSQEEKDQINAVNKATR